jgi:hypothetical protein
VLFITWHTEAQIRVRVRSSLSLDLARHTSCNFFALFVLGSLLHREACCHQMQSGFSCLVGSAIDGNRRCHRRSSSLGRRQVRFRPESPPLLSSSSIGLPLSSSSLTGLPLLLLRSGHRHKRDHRPCCCYGRSSASSSVTRFVAATDRYDWILSSSFARQRLRVVFIERHRQRL